MLCEINKFVNCFFAKQFHFIDWSNVRERNEQTIVKNKRITKRNYFAILLLTWTYILFARWVKLQLFYDLRCSFSFVDMHYSNLKTTRLNNDENIFTNVIIINIDDNCERTARWWIAILIFDEDWHAKIQVKDKIYRSSWFAYIAFSQVFKFRTKNVKVVNQKQFDISSSFDKTLKYLCEYCKLHKIDDQCIFALTISLFFFWKNIDQNVFVILFFSKISQRLIFKSQRKLLFDSFRLKKCFKANFIYCHIIWH